MIRITVHRRGGNIIIETLATDDVEAVIKEHEITTYSHYTIKEI